MCLLCLFKFLFDLIVFLLQEFEVTKEGGSFRLGLAEESLLVTLSGINLLL
jgi:hypothetical protein